jgi:hypothetical protein
MYRPHGASGSNYYRSIGAKSNAQRREEAKYEKEYLARKQAAVNKLAALRIERMVSSIIKKVVKNMNKKN